MPNASSNWSHLGDDDAIKKSVPLENVFLVLRYCGVQCCDWMNAIRDTSRVIGDRADGSTQTNGAAIDPVPHFTKVCCGRFSADESRCLGGSCEFCSRPPACRACVKQVGIERCWTCRALAAEKLEEGVMKLTGVGDNTKREIEVVMQRLKKLLVSRRKGQDSSANAGIDVNIE